MAGEAYRSLAARMGPVDPDEPDELSSDILRDVPLFRELQRVLFSGSGPINWELARQVGIASAVGDRPDPEPSEEDHAGLEATVRAAELAVADLTGLEPPAEVAHVEAIRRTRWVDANTHGLRPLFEPAAERLATAMSDASRDELPLAGEEGPGLEGLAGMQALLGRVSPLIVGTQLGVALGHLGRRVLGQYEIPVPRAGQEALQFVLPNIEALEAEWDLPPQEFRAWVALHEVTHAFQLGRAWVHDHVLAQVRELARGLSFDLSGIEERLAGFDLADPEGLQEALGDPAALLGQTLSDEQQLIVRRIQALVAVAEGHADHVMEALGRRMLGQYARIDEAMRRRREGRGEEDRLVERMLGVELQPEHERLGREFCDRVAEATDERTLARMWESADQLPSMPELEEPTLWLARTV